LQSTGSASFVREAGKPQAPQPPSTSSFCPLTKPAR
jgi:hypothetical protein